MTQDIDSQIYELQLESAMQTAEQVLTRLKGGESNYALMLADEVKHSLTLMRENERASVVKAMSAWIDTHANGHAGQMYDVLGIVREVSPPVGDGIKDNIIYECLQAAATEDSTARRDDLILQAAKMLTDAHPLVKDRWRKEFARLVGVSAKTFERLISHAATGKAADTESKPESKAKTPTDDELADVWKHHHLNTACTAGEFRQYEAGVWRTVDDDRIDGEITAVMVAAKGQGVKPSSHLLASVKKFCEVGCYLPPARWDNDPDLLVCKNGTLHIPTMTLRAHSPDDYQTSGVSFDYDPKATAPVWERYLRTTIPDAASFLQEFSGYALTTDTSFEIAVWLYGAAGSGKSTFLTGLQAMLGERAGLLGLADIERSRFALADLPGKTLVIATEQPSAYMQATHILNAVISGEQITVDRKYREAVTITPRAKLAWAMNDLPRVPDAGNGLFRRVKVVKFQKREHPDPMVKELIKQEGAGILLWALKGLARLLERGQFEIPPCVQDATAQFQSSNDVPALFVAECCYTGSEYKAQSGALYSAYKQWCIDNGHKPQSSTSMAGEWERLGFERYAAMGKRFWRGVGLRE